MYFVMVFWLRSSFETRHLKTVEIRVPPDRLRLRPNARSRPPQLLPSRSKGRSGSPPCRSAPTWQPGQLRREPPRVLTRWWSTAGRFRCSFGPSCPLSWLAGCEREGLRAGRRTPRTRWCTSRGCPGSRDSLPVGCSRTGAALRSRGSRPCQDTRVRGTRHKQDSTTVATTTIIHNTPLIHCKQPWCVYVLRCWAVTCNISASDGKFSIRNLITPDDLHRKNYWEYPHYISIPVDEQINIFWTRFGPVW